MSLQTRLLTAGALLAALGFGSAASADIVKAYYQTSSWFEYDISHMPDFDQRRDGELDNDGNAHCVPTSSFNMIAYAINHGFDELTPGGPHSWQAQAHYDLVTDSIEALGALMGTDGSSGTTIDGQQDGLTNWVAPSGKFTVETYLAANNWAPRLPNLAQWAVDGSLVTLCYGRWEVNGTHEWNGFDFPQLDRTSGHCVTMNGAWATPAWYKVRFRDPADDGTNSTQSTFVSREFDLDTITYALKFSDAWVITMDRLVLDPDPGDGLIRLIDGAGILTPKQGYAFTDSTLEIVTPEPFNGDQFTTLPMPTHDHPPSDLVYSLGGYLVLYANPGGGSDLFRFNPQTGTDVQVASIPGGKKLVEGRCLDLYVLTETHIHCYGIVPGNADNDAYELRASAALPCGGDALIYDDATDEIVIVCCSDAKVLRFPKGLPSGTPPIEIDIPSTIPLGDPCAIDVSPVDGCIWIASAGDPSTLYSLCGDSIPLPSPQTTPNLSFDDLGNIFACTTDGMVEFADFGIWSQVIDSDFAGYPINGCLRMRRSRTNFDPATHDENWDVNTSPDEIVFGNEVLDCDADLDGDRLVSVTDLLLLLASWGGDGVADINLDGSVDISDLLDLLAAWGPCP